MSAIRYVSGDATRPFGFGNVVVAHVVNDRGGFGRGFALALAKRWPDVADDYRAWARNGWMAYRSGSGEPFELGSTMYTFAEDTHGRRITVAHMLAQHGYAATVVGGPPIRYDALQRCLDDVATYAGGSDASVHMPRIGCGLAGGTWDRVEPLITAALSARDIDVTVYDLPTDGKAKR